MSDRRPTAAQRKAVFDRAEGLCEYCRCPASFATHAFSLDHIHPVNEGGRTALDNLALACQGCNNYKYVALQATDPLTGYQAPLYNPRLDHWNDHFTWSSDWLRIVGLTPAGRATVRILRLNRDSVVNLRRILLITGLHPPAVIK